MAYDERGFAVVQALTDLPHQTIQVFGINGYRLHMEARSGGRRGLLGA
ncbi:MAG: hypothetical protein WDO73_10020 [Ignavibacteriota bacterium]